MPQPLRPSVRVLTGVRDLFRDRSRWIAGTLAVTQINDLTTSTRPESPNAVAWCAVGAIHKVGRAEGLTNAGLAHCETLLGNELRRLYGGTQSVAGHNDQERGYEKIMAALDSLLERLNPSRRRREAAEKGWITRRTNLANRAGVVDESSEPLTLVFGGTLPGVPTDATTADARKEVADVRT